MNRAFSIGFYVDSVPFTRDVIDGVTSLGGSESACLGLARALKARGHDVHIIATKLDESCEGPDYAGLVWHSADDFPLLNQFIEWDVFCVLRMFPVYAGPPIRARLRLLWNQDLCTQPKALMGGMWAVDQMVYVSEYQRRQYEDRLPELKQAGVFVTKNGYDPARVPADATKDPNRIIHVSRPERALRPILAMWPEIRKANPHAELRLCRYSSMYDAQGWAKICASYDRAVEEVHEQVGGVVWLGELGKARLYQEIAEAAVMWYPGVHDFAETSCIAAIEAQACGTPFVGSFKGALPETVPAGVLVKGSADEPPYQHESIEAVLALLDGCRNRTFAYRQFQRLGLKHVERYTYDVIASEWDAWIDATFIVRYGDHKSGILRQMLHDDDHVVAKHVAEDLATSYDLAPRELSTADRADYEDAITASRFCDEVIAGRDQSAESYFENALKPINELRYEQNNRGRMGACLAYFEGCTHVLDVACGNGAFALLLAEKYPTITVTGIDYAEGNIAAAKKAAEELGLSDRVSFICAPFWDFDQQEPADWLAGLTGSAGAFDEIDTCDGAFIGEFVEHVAACDKLIDRVEEFLQPGAAVVYTCPHGPFTDLMERGRPIHRGHVHQFCHDDISVVFSDKTDLAIEFLPVGLSRRGADLGHWVISYKTGGGPARPRPVEHRALTCRPQARLTVGMIVGPYEPDLRRCLETVWAIADEIVIGDCGMEATEQAIAAEFKARIVAIGPVMEHPEGFAGVRNEVLQAASGDWFIWIDADERLVGGVGLRKYLDSGPYAGYALRQQHLMLDAPAGYDTPVRLFRRRPDIQFYGCIHEQPQMGDCNGAIVPALELHDVSIAHTGYLIEHQRREKMLRRNLPLLKRDRVMFPERRLGRLLWLRDYVNISDYKKAQADGQLTPECTQLLKQTVALFEKEFQDPKDQYHDLARPWYERALQDLGIGIELELALAGKRGGMKNGHAKPRRVWVRQHADLGRLLQHELDTIKTQMHPEPLKTDPFVDPVSEPQAEGVAVR